jgi:hypothetical protein
VWPDLLILSPPGVSHRFPLRPSNGYGRWWFSLDEWRAHVLGWEPRVSAISLTRRELANLAEALRLTPFTPAAEPAPIVDGALDSFVAWSRRVPGEPGQGAVELAGWLRDLSEQVRTLQRRVAELEQSQSAPQNNQRPPLAQAGAPGPLIATAQPASRAWTEPERQALIDAIGDLRWSGRSRALPTILEFMNDHLGYSLKDTGYNGFGTAAAMFERARSDGLIKYGPRSGPNPTIYLPDEELPPPAARPNGL